MSLPVEALRRAPLEAIIVALKHNAVTEDERVVWHSWVSVVLGLPVGDGTAPWNGEVGEYVPDHVLTLEEAASGQAINSRRKNDKFGILDSPSHYEMDFVASVGICGVSVIYFDLDHFKLLNTRFTETSVDKALLPELLELLVEPVRSRGFAYAEGGDEFVITLPNTNTALAEAFAVVLLEKIRTRTFKVDCESVRVTASAGIASSMSPTSAQRCRDAASAAKQDAKAAGRDRYVISAQRT